MENPHQSCHMGSQCYLPTDTSERALPNPSQKGWYLIYIPRTDGGLSWPGSWLHTKSKRQGCSLSLKRLGLETVSRHFLNTSFSASCVWFTTLWFSHLQTVTHPSINRARRRVTTLIETNVSMDEKYRNNVTHRWLHDMWELWSMKPLIWEHSNHLNSTVAIWVQQL